MKMPQPTHSLFSAKDQIFADASPLVQTRLKDFQEPLVQVTQATDDEDFTVLQPVAGDPLVPGIQGLLVLLTESPSRRSICLDDSLSLLKD